VNSIRKRFVNFLFFSKEQSSGKRYGSYVRSKVKVKVKQSRYRPGVAQRVPGS
jgi:hypothetical protein